MTYAYSERLSAMDALFLEIENPSAHMHIGSIGIFELGPLATPEGGLAFERIVELARAQIHKAPRFRQKIAWVPGFGHPVWIDDASFNLDYHLRHTALPGPGDERQLKRLAGRIMSQQLDRGKPLWELWLVSGLDGGRFAAISKIHHCMADGISGVDALSVLMGPDPDYRPRPAPKWVPRPAPSSSQLLWDEGWRLARLPLSLLPESSQEEGPEEASWKHAGSTDSILRGLRDAASAGAGAPTATSLNVDVGPHRRIDWTRLDLQEVREVGGRAGGKINDVVLAIVSGALRRFLKQRGERVETLDFRAAIPVSVRSATERGSLGNRVASLVMRLPIDEPDPWQRLLRVIDLTRDLKGSGQSRGVEAVGRMADLVPAGWLGGLARWGMRHQAANIIVTNVPAAPVPVYMAGARLLAPYPVVPLMPNQGVGVALLSYNGGLFWGLNADWDTFPDLHDLEEEVQTQFEQLRRVAVPAASAEVNRSA